MKDYHTNSNYVPELAYLEGPWFCGRESIEACPLEGRPSRLLVPYRAAEVNLVMSPPEGGEAIATITLDGKPLSDEAGEDVVRMDGQSVVLVQEPRMYRLVKGRKVESRLLELSTSAPGLEAYAFTFVSCTMDE